MKAIILAAGKGSRLGNKNTHKALTPLWGEALFERQLRLLNDLGINNVAVVTGFLEASFDCYPVKKYINDKFEQSNMVHSLLCAHDFLFSDESPLLILYGDIAYHISVLEQLINAPGEIVVPGNSQWLNLWNQRMDDPLDDAESFIFENNSLKLLNLGERLTSSEQAMAQFMGMIKLTANGMQQVHSLIEYEEPDFFQNMAMTDFIQWVIDRNVIVKTCLINGRWIELDTADDYRLYQEQAASHFLIEDSE